MRPRVIGSVATPALTAWLRSHEGAIGAEVARCRLAFMDLEGQARFIRGLVGTPWVRPRVLVTSQVSGRWSTTDPPLANLPKEQLGIIVPEYGTFWVVFDLIAVEALLAATYAQEDHVLGIIRDGGDIHIDTAQRMFPGEVITKDDPRRQLAKITGYNLAYAYDYRGILEAKDLSIFGGRAAALEFARSYLAARPGLVAAKQRVFSESYRTHQARSAFGRRRYLTGDERTQAKDGWSHTIQSTVSGMMNRLIPRMLALDPGARFVLNKHDGAILAYPRSVDPSTLVAYCQAIVNEPWALWGRKVVAPATWAIVRCPEEEGE